nr:F-box protein At2g26160-like [Malus domestica]
MVRRNLSMSISEWASLPEALIFLILDNLLEPIDHVRFAAVCKEWCYLSKVYNLATQRWLKVLPMLLIPSQLESQTQVETTGPTTRAVYSINEGKVYENVRLPVPYSKICRGSSHGWLATIDLADQPINITLVNPFTKETIRLPPLEFEAQDMNLWFHPYENFVQKVILSTDPSLNRDNYMVVAIYRGVCRLAFTKAGEKYWRSIHINVTDAVFYKNKIYAVGYRLGSIFSVDVEKSHAYRRQPFIQIAPFIEIGQADWEYLVESIKGDLLQVRMFAIKDGRTKGSWTESFCVYKVVFDDSNRTIRKVEVKDIGDEALFLGVNHSFSVLASNFVGCKPNCIYHTCKLNPTGMNIFNLEDKSITRIQVPSPNCDPTSRIPPAIWIFPTFNGLGH